MVHVQKEVRLMLDLFIKDILEFYRDPENIRGLNEYRKQRARNMESIEKDTAKGGSNLHPTEANLKIAKDKK